MKKLLFVCIVCLSMIAAVMLSPYYTAYQLNVAYKNKDGRTIADSIDYANLQYNLSNQLMVRLDDTLAKNSLLKKMTGSVFKIGKPFVKTAINAAITPENIEHAINSRGQVNEATKQLAIAWAVATNKIDVSALFKELMTQETNVELIIQKQIEQHQRAEQDTTDDSQQVQLRYCGFNCFKITGEIKGYPLTVEMQRQGFTQWKVVDLKLP